MSSASLPKHKYGAHPSAEAAEAAQACRTEALEKVDQGFVKLMPWKTLRANIAKGLLTHTKISPIAAIPHKSRLFRMILRDSRTIQKLGRWKSQTFMDYIHDQISAFSAGVSIKMANPIPFRCIVGPTLTHSVA
ncbi:hypothetical protein SEMRO_329_G118860.1 [Seminavis robusta]|uniref:Uncharacterized protein n=1 Tax=Seminavis robusta TaxID=568900 RepID=A0A9N8DS42_9STRA|nr:hypothetical protein SEMRO_329_G118860.1 [Seminavis robusta]|eukprot:Sro329_g118860.1 n/a (134) ;mRNA; r:75103-75663